MAHFAIPHLQDYEQHQPKRKKRKTNRNESPRNEPHENDNIDLNNFDYYISIDPGVVNIVGVCVRDPVGEEIEVKLKAAAFMNTACKKRVRKYKLKKLTSRHERFLDMERDKINKEVNIAMTPKMSRRFFSKIQYVH
ncbi:hypothetical protein ABEB36_002087 [Hypothenemus hampei]|uniref:Uncharacterized protein n=1 Tax=Hypothenemus hampei TaxID=57062 RepID=A0ABD1F4I5_HYPHA